MHPTTLLLSAFVPPAGGLFILLFVTQPHPSFPSPKEKGRCCITSPNFITTTSAIYLHSPLSECIYFIIVIRQARTLCCKSSANRRRHLDGPSLIIRWLRHRCNK